MAAIRTIYDAIVIGAGVAGSVAALLLARQGLSVLVLDRKIEDRVYKKLCTHFLQPVALPVIERLGLDAEIARLGVPTKAAFWTRAGWIDPPGDYSIDATGERLVAFNIERRILDPLLIGKLRDEPSAKVVLGHAAPQITQGGDGMWQAIMHGTGTMHEEVVLGRALLAADGRNSQMATTLNNPLELEGENQRACIFAYVEGIAPPHGNRSLFYLLDDVMSFLYPLGARRALLAAYVPKAIAAKFREQGRGAALLELFRGLPDCPVLTEARIASPIFGYSDYPNRLRRPVHAGVAFIGDAAISLDPMSGIGCAFAMLSADMAVRALSSTLTAQSGGNSAGVETALREYDAEFRGFFPAHAKGIMADSKIGKSSQTIDSVYARIARDPGLQRKFIALTGRLLTPTAFQKAYLAAVRGGAKAAEPAGARS